LHKRLLAWALCVCTALSGAACGNTAGSNGGGLSKTQEITVCIGPQVQTLDPALNASVDGATYLANAFAGLYAYRQDGSDIVIAPECAQAIALPLELEGGRYKYQILLREGLKWSDGSELLASDFAYAWQRAADPKTGSPYRYMFNVIEGYSLTSPNLSVTADDEKGVIEVTTSTHCAYFDQLLCCPIFSPVKREIVEANPDDWANHPETYISNGPFCLKGYEQADKTMVFQKNPEYWDSESVILEEIRFAISDDEETVFSDYEAGTYSLIDTVPISKITELKESRLGSDFFIGTYIGTYYLEFNVNYSFKPGLLNASSDEAAWEGWTSAQNALARYALALLIDREFLADKVLQAGQIPADGLIPAGMDDGDGNEFRSVAKPWWGLSAAANRAQAFEILESLGYKRDGATFTNFPSWVFSTNANANNLAIAQAVQTMWKEYGIACTIEQRDWNAFQELLRDGAFMQARMGWIADFDDPINLLEVFSVDSGNNHPQLGKSGIVGLAKAYGPNADLSWEEYYQADIDSIKASSDAKARSELMIQAEEKLFEAMPVIPLYYYTKPYLQSSSLKGVLHSKLGWISFKNAFVENGAKKAPSTQAE